MPYLELATNRYPVSESQIKSENPQVSFPRPFVAPEGYALVFPAPAPAHDPITQYVHEIAPVLTVLGHYEQAYAVLALDDATIAVNQAKEVERIAKIEADRIASLWQSAHDYEYAQVSGSAIGLLAMGVMQGKPKCIAVQNWIKGIWTEYYIRKAGTSTNYDFSAMGACPYSVPELMAELGL